MLLIKANGDYPRHIGDLQLEYPDFTEGDLLPEGWFEVEASPIPEAEPDEVWEEVKPVLEDGKYKQTFTVRAMTAEEKAYRDAPVTAKNKLVELGFTDFEIQALTRGLVR